MTQQVLLLETLDLVVSDFMVLMLPVVFPVCARLTFYPWVMSVEEGSLPAKCDHLHAIPPNSPSSASFNPVLPRGMCVPRVVAEGTVHCHVRWDLFVWEPPRKCPRMVQCP